MSSASKIGAAFIGERVPVAKITPVPEPDSDIRAQIAAMLDQAHPKMAVLIVPGNEVPDLPSPLGVYRVETENGTLLTRDAFSASLIANDPSDLNMAAVLGYPEDKWLVGERCGGEHVVLARAVQARDGNGNVVSEAFASPVGLVDTVRALEEYIPDGGYLAVMMPADAIMRRIALRLAEATNG